nr:DUF1801 domain-containing protein [Flavobacterium sp. LM4]
MAAIPKPVNIDEYIGSFPNDIQEILEKVRMTIHEAVPDAKEKISYSMPAFEQNGIVVYLQLLKIILGSMHCQAVMNNLKKHSLNTNQAKVTYNSH